MRWCSLRPTPEGIAMHEEDLRIERERAEAWKEFSDNFSGEAMFAGRLLCADRILRVHIPAVLIALGCGSGAALLKSKEPVTSTLSAIEAHGYLMYDIHGELAKLQMDQSVEEHELIRRTLKEVICCGVDAARVCQRYHVRRIDARQDYALRRATHAACMAKHATTLGDLREAVRKTESEPNIFLSVELKMKVTAEYYRLIREEAITEEVLIRTAIQAFAASMPKEEA